MSQNYDEIIEPRENDEQRAARENRLRAAKISRRFSEIDRARISFLYNLKISVQR